MDILAQIRHYASAYPDRLSCRSGSHTLNYARLEAYSDRLAAYLHQKTTGRKPVIVVYGHKHPFMQVCMTACIKAGLTYCPVDTSMPAERIRDILTVSESPLVLSVEPFPALPGGGAPSVLSFSDMERIFTDETCDVQDLTPLSPEDICYIIFTSGSTGRPKGVQIPYGCLCRFVDWGLTLGTTAAEKTGKRFLNQAPFSFDLSVMDLYLCLASGGTLCTLTKEVQQQYRLLFEQLQEYQPQIWVSTPSFAELCLADPSFNGDLLPELELFLFCGERLTNRTAEKLMERFPAAKVMNTYGPTESTVAVTEVEVTPALLKEEDPLPVGRPRPGTRILIRSEAGEFLPDGQSGEIVITGDTLSSGYFKAPELTAGAFRLCSVPVPGGPEGSLQTVTGYHTGDEGYLKNGMLFYNGRLDLQVKLHGYRIELSDIENNLLRIAPVEQACVVASGRDGRISQLHAFVVLGSREEENDRKQAALLKDRLSALLPEYMVPRKFHFLTQIPMTPNGKADRRKLKEMLG